MTMEKEKAKEISELVESFCKQYLNGELAACSSRLCDKLSRSRKLDITRGKKEIWAASIVYVIARVNFLFDKANNNFLTSDIICDFFGTKKTTTGNKATSLERVFNIGIGDGNYCTREITESFSFVEMPGGFIVPKKMANEMGRDVVIEIASEEESQEIEEFMAEKKRQEAEAERDRKERRAEITREIAEKKQKRRKRNKQKQMSGNLSFGDKLNRKPGPFHFSARLTVREDKHPPCYPLSMVGKSRWDSKTVRIDTRSKCTW